MKNPLLFVGLFATLTFSCRNNSEPVHQHNEVVGKPDSVNNQEKDHHEYLTTISLNNGEKWSANADEISDFLSKANPNWKLADMKKMMHDHLTLTTDEAVARLKKDYAADVKAYDKVHDEILMMADMLTDGIIKQFPGKF